MPKKHKKPFAYTKPTNTPHHSLASSGESPRVNQNGRLNRAGPARNPEHAIDDSVNDLISHLRRTQGLVSSESPSGPNASIHAVPQRSVPPALRNVLELPEPSAPRPRHNARTQIGARPRRAAPGPPPPQSWLTHSSRESSDYASEEGNDARSPPEPIHRLNRLPGEFFRDENSLEHLAFQSMATQWDWHSQNDDLDVCAMPAHLKSRLLSYIGFYASIDTMSKSSMNGLNPIYLTKEECEAMDETYSINRAGSILKHDAGTYRLDLSNALGSWLTMKQLSKSLILFTHRTGSSFEQTKRSNFSSDSRNEDPVPESWDQMDNQLEENSIPKYLGPTLRFEKLKYLSLAHPHGGSASWSSLVGLLSQLSTITHLSLAHWPPPARTARKVDKTSLQLRRSNIDFAQASVVLREFARNTYCLKWLDLEGCSEWIEALTWRGTDPDGNLYPLGVEGPDWNSSWRNVDHLILTPGFSSSQVNAPPLSFFDLHHDIASNVASELRERRRKVRGKWIVVETDDEGAL